MKVFVYGDGLFSIDMIWGLKELGHDAKLFSPRTIQEINDRLFAEEADLLITLGSPAYFRPDLLAHLGTRPKPSMKYVHWDTDGITWENIEMSHINLFKPDIVFTVCPDMLELLRSKNIQSDMLFYAFSPISHHPELPAGGCKGLITFMGGAYPDIIKRYPNHYRRLSMDILFRPLLENGNRIDFYGDNLHKQIMKSLYDFDVPDTWLHGRCPYDKTSYIYSGSFINLVTQNHEHGLTKRLFEIMGSGGFALSYDNAAVREYFSPGKDLAVSSSPSLTIEMVEYYGSHPEEYRMIRENALTSVQNHSYKQRAEYILKRLNISAS